jgi:hypothetical protein
LGLLKGKHSNPDRGPNVVSSPAAFRVGIDRSNNIAISKPQIDVYTLLMVVRV